MAPRSKRPRAQSPYDIDEFQSSASAFGEYEEKALKIRIKGTDDVSKIFPGYSEVGIDPDLEHLRLEGFDYNRVLMFTPSTDEDLDDVQIRFLMKLKHVLRNGISESPESRFEPYIQVMVDIFLRECKLDDCTHLEMLPSKLRLKVVDEEFITFSDREGRKGEQLVWVLQESKHQDDMRYNDGNVQLVSALIAACEQNYSRVSADIFPQVMYGINVKGDEVSIMRAEFSKEYIVSLCRGLPKQKLQVKTYPKGKGLKLSSPESRSEILCLMTKLRKHALSINIPCKTEEESSDDEE